MGKIISVSNQKGGVGKTTTSLSLAASLGVLEKKVLLVDADPQGNASSGIGISKDDYEKSCYDVLLNQCKIEESIIQTKSTFLLSKFKFCFTSFSFSSFGHISRRRTSTPMLAK